MHGLATGASIAVLLAALAVAPPARSADDDIVIGFAIAQSGWMNAYDGPPLKGAQMAIDDINAKGGVLGRKLEMVVADETENPETGISAIKKLTADEKVDVLIGGYTSGVTLAQLPHISAAKTIG